MSAFNLARGALAFIAHAAVEFIRPHRCGFGGPGCYRTNSFTDMERHYYIEHAGDRMTVPEGHIK